MLLCSRPLKTTQTGSCVSVLRKLRQTLQSGKIHRSTTASSPVPGQRTWPGSYPTIYINESVRGPRVEIEQKTYFVNRPARGRDSPPLQTTRLPVRPCDAACTLREAPLHAQIDSHAHPRNYPPVREVDPWSWAGGIPEGITIYPLESLTLLSGKKR